jgi:hypothetical protein
MYGKKGKDQNTTASYAKAHGRWLAACLPLNIYKAAILLRNFLNLGALMYSLPLRLTRGQFMKNPVSNKRP